MQSTCRSARPCRRDKWFPPNGFGNQGSARMHRMLRVCQQAVRWQPTTNSSRSQSQERRFDGKARMGLQESVGKANPTQDRRTTSTVASKTVNSSVVSEMLSTRRSGNWRRRVYRLSASGKCQLNVCSVNSYDSKLAFTLRTIPSFFIRKYKVERFNPRRAAAPPGPERTQLVSFSVFRIWFRSTSSRV